MVGEILAEIIYLLSPWSCISEVYSKKYRFICVKDVRVNFILNKINLGGNAEQFVLKQG